MLGKVIGAVVGGKIAQKTSKVGGPTGAAIGAAVPFILSRMSIPAMLVIGAGGYALKKYLDKDELPQPDNKKTAPVASAPQPKPGDAATA